MWAIFANLLIRKNALKFAFEYFLFANSLKQKKSMVHNKSKKKFEVLKCALLN